MHQECLQRFLYQFFELISPSDAKVALIVRTPSRPPFLKVQFFKNMNAYASVPKNGLFIHKFFFFVRSNELKHQKNEILWLDLNHSSIQNLAQVARNRDFLQHKQHTPESNLNEI